MTPAQSTPHGADATDPRPRTLFASVAEGARRLLVRREPARAVGGLARRHDHVTTERPLDVALSRFQMVGLSEVQARLADRWPKLSEKVHLIAQNTISRHLVRGDVFERHGEDGYLVLFATLGAEEAEFKSRIIAREIAQHLLGESEAAGLEVSEVCASIRLEALAGEDREAAIATALTRAESDADAGVSSSRRRAEDGPETTATLLPNHRYTPVWDAKQMTLLRFRGYVPPTGLAADDERTRESEGLRCDLALIRAVTDDLEALTLKGRRLPITVAIQHTSITSDSQRTRLRQALADIPELQRKLITIEICNPREDFWSYGCKTFVEMTRGFGIGCSALVGLDARQLAPARGNFLSVAVHLGEYTGREADGLRLLSAFAASARARGFECSAYGLASRALVLGAVGAGFRHLAGPAVHHDVPGLTQALRFEPLDLYPDFKHAAART